MTMPPAYLKGPERTPIRCAHVSCAGKVGYPSAFVAFAIVQRSPHALDHYHCDFCGKWHLGNHGVAVSAKARRELVRAE